MEGLRAQTTRVNRRLGWVLVSAMGFASFALGQSPAMLAGKVTDVTGAIIPNVLVRVTDRKSGKSVQAKTNVEGIFTITKLGAGTYKLQAIAPGFELYMDASVKLPASGEIRLEIQMSDRHFPDVVDFPVARPPSK